MRFISFSPFVATRVHREQAEVTRSAGSGTHSPSPPASREATGPSAAGWEGRTATLPMETKIPIKGHGVAQDVAVLEDRARGQSACLEFASPCCNRSDVQKTALGNPRENVNSSIFPILPFSFCFTCFSSQSTLRTQTTHGF